MAKLTYEELKQVVANAVTTQKISNSTFSVTTNNIVGLADKIGKIVFLDTIYSIDKLAMFDGEYLGLGKTIEEWSMDLQMPEDYDPTGADALAPHYGTYRPVFYSYTIGRKTIPASIPNNNIERAVNSESEFVSVVSMITKRLNDSMAVYRYECKRELLARYIELVESEMDQSNATAFGSLTSASPVGTLVKGTATEQGILVKKVASAPASWSAGVSAGNIIPLHLVTTTAIPVDTATGEAFVKEVKGDVEKAGDLNEGYSLNGNSLGATEGLVLIVKQGVIPSIQVDTLAGAFNKDEMAFGVEVVVVKDFGSYTGTAFAVLCDKRAMRLHNTYRATRENLNGKGDFLNLYAHTEDTAYASRNCFVKVYKA